MRVRFAPSPRGFLHLGGLRTALFNFLIARKHPEGRFILRIEDTDRNRFVETAIEGLQKTLQWAGINYDEGPDKVGNYGPYIQSQRLPIYQRHSHEIIENGRAYRCFCNKERLELTKGINGGRYDGHCRRLSKKDSEVRANNNEPFVLRFKASDEQKSIIIDEVYGPLKSNTIDDIILMKSDGFPTYHFANIIDDHLMKIELVMRGAEWIPSTPLHGLLYDAFGWSKPKFAHLPLLINPDGSKLSKRQDSAHVSHYIYAGFLPHIKRDNSQLIQDLNSLVNASFNLSFSDNYLRQVIKISADRIFFLKDIISLCPYFFIDPDYHSLEANEFITKQREYLLPLIQLKSYAEIISMPILRFVMTACRVGPSIQETVQVLGDETCRRRFEKFKLFMQSNK